MTTWKSSIASAMLLATVLASQVHAFAIVNTDNYVINYLAAQGPNNTGVDTGLFLYVGGRFDPVANTSVTATQGALSVNIPYNGASAPDLFARGTKILTPPQLSNLTAGAWTLTATNPGFSSVVVQTNAILPSVVSYFQSSIFTSGLVYASPFGVSVNNLSTNPTITWSINPNIVSPVGATYTPYSYITYPNAQSAINGGGIYPIVGNSVTHYFDPAYGTLSVGQNYRIVVSSAFVSPTDGSVQGTADTFYPFTPSALSLEPNVPIFLGQTASDGVYTFDNPVQGNDPVYLDPTAAIGYDFQIGQGDPLFASVKFPDLGAFDYSLYLWSGSKYVFDALVAPDTQFFFPGGGVSQFRVSGIDPGLGIDPLNGTAFPAEVTFASGGMFTGTMTPLTVPEPATLTLLGLGLAGLGFSRRRKPH